MLEVTLLPTDPMVVGQVAVLGVVVTNRGPAVAAAPVTVVIVLPTGVEYTGGVARLLDVQYAAAVVSNTWSCVADGGATVTCIGPDALRAGESSQLDLVVEAHPEAAGTTSVGACATSPSSDPAAADACAQGVLVVLLPGTGTPPGQNPGAPARLPNTGSPDNNGVPGLAAILALTAGATLFMLGFILRWLARPVTTVRRHASRPRYALSAPAAACSRVSGTSEQDTPHRAAAPQPVARETRPPSAGRTVDLLEHHQADGQGRGLPRVKEPQLAPAVSQRPI